MSEDEATLREDEIAKAVALTSWGFAFPLGDGEPWLRRAGLENVHVVRRGGAIDATVITIPMGQYFGGKSVPMAGVAGVATSAEARGTGAAVTLMTRVLREKRAEGFAVSTLYPATLGLYRKLGYERAGAHYTTKVPLASITLRDRELPLRDMTEGDAGRMSPSTGSATSSTGALSPSTGSATSSTGALSPSTGSATSSTG